MSSTARKAGHTLWQAALGSGGVATLVDAFSHGTLNASVVEQSGGVVAVAVLSAGSSALYHSVLNAVKNRSASKAATFERLVAVEVSKRLYGLIPVPGVTADVTLSSSTLPQGTPGDSGGPVVVPGTGNALPDAGAHTV